MTDTFPLKWPIGHARTKKWNRNASNFKVTPSRARDGLIRQLSLMGASQVVLSSNVETYRRGGQDVMYADQSGAKEDPGVAIYFTWKAEQYALACDKWDKVADNVQALSKTVEAIRGIERWGTGEMMRSAFAGFKELPEVIVLKTWYEILGVQKLANAETIKQAYRSKAMVMHPDKGGSVSEFQNLNRAYEYGLAQLR